MNKLDARETKFLQRYLIHLDPKRAGIEAGYSETMAATKCYQWVSNSKVKPLLYEAMLKVMDKRAEKAAITQQMVLDELAKIGFSDIRKAVRWTSNANVAAVDNDDDMQALVDEGAIRYHVTNQVELISSDEIDDATAAAISEIGQSATGALKIKFHDKKAALVDIGRHLGMFKERMEITGEDGGPISVVRRVIVDAKEGGD